MSNNVALARFFFFLLLSGSFSVTVSTIYEKPFKNAHTLIHIRTANRTHGSSTRAAYGNVFECVCGVKRNARKLSHLRNFQK